MSASYTNSRNIYPRKTVCHAGTSQHFTIDPLIRRSQSPTRAEIGDGCRDSVYGKCFLTSYRRNSIQVDHPLGTIADPRGDHLAILHLIRGVVIVAPLQRCEWVIQDQLRCLQAQVMVSVGGPDSCCRPMPSGIS